MITVIGGANIDIGGCSHAPLVMRDSNPGTVVRTLGGVGRNIAENLARMGQSVKLITVLGEDHEADLIENSCRYLGMDISGIVRIPGMSTSFYVYIADSSGDMKLAVNDMSIYEEMTPEFLEPFVDIINAESELVVLDANLPEESIEFLTEHCKMPVFADAVSAAKTMKLKSSLGRLHTIKPNRLEAEMLSGVRITDEGSLNKAADRLLATGLSRVFITLGNDGVLAAERDGGRVRLANPLETAKNTSGCGDAFTAAVAMATVKGIDLEGTARYGLAAAAITLQSAETINRAMSAEALEKKWRELA